jgi:hypothetical protein
MELLYENEKLIPLYLPVFLLLLDLLPDLSQFMTLSKNYLALPSFSP